MCPANNCFKRENVGVFSSFYAVTETRFVYGFRELFDDNVSLFDPSFAKVGVWHSCLFGLSSGVLPLSCVVEALGSPLLELNKRVRVSIPYFTLNLFYKTDFS